MNIRFIFMWLISVALLLQTSAGYCETFQWDTSHVPQDSFLTITCNVQRILNYKKADSETRKGIDEHLKRIFVNVGGNRPIPTLSLWSIL